MMDHKQPVQDQSDERRVAMMKLAQKDADEAILRAWRARIWHAEEENTDDN